MAEYLVIVVTGTSRGIGKGIVNVLARQKLDRSLVIYATSRSGKDTGVEPVPPNEIHYGKLDTTNKDSIKSLFDKVIKSHGAVDVLINNAAISDDDHEALTLWNNYGGTRDMCDAFLSQPTIRPGARIVSVTSGLNALSTYGENVQKMIREASNVSDIDAVAQRYHADVVAGPQAQESAGWGTSARSYKVSKALINTLTVVLAKKHANVLINSCCPGWTDTDMGKQGKGTPPKTPEQGAQTAVRCAIGDLGPGGDEDGGLGQESDNVSGRFYENANIVAVGWGSSKLWMET
ncbi:NAD(P)-binding protein [Phaeosphaeriaceae sp. SRC1lsM3a]|nr:NAD(P)-binding protein [Stagonospora sp. SRC1lsM3a]